MWPYRGEACLKKNGLSPKFTGVALKKSDFAQNITDVSLKRTGFGLQMTGMINNRKMWP